MTREQREKLKRLERAKRLLDSDRVWPIFGQPGKFFVQSSDGERWGYLVDLSCHGCTCTDWDRRYSLHGGWCKHAMAAWLLVHHPKDYRGWLPPWAKQ